MNSIVGLSNTNVGQAIVRPLIDSGEILRLSKEVVQPYYRKKSEQTQEWIRQYFDDSTPYRLHRSEGAFFLWLWFEGLPISSREFYERLKQRDVLVVPGNYFFFGIDDQAWPHRDECLRVSFAMREEIVRDGLRIIGEEAARAYRE